MLNIVVPMAGRGSRFAAAGFSVPKPLIPVRGSPMIELVVDNIRPSRPHRFVFLCLAEHMERYHVDQLLEHIAPGCAVHVVDQVTEGAACTVLLARALIDDDEPLMLANSDQWVDADIDDYLQVLDDSHADGLIMTMTADDPKWSFVRLDQHDRVVDVVEKEVVSNEATVGIYNFRRGADFVRAADAMVSKDLRVNGEFYVAPVYNQLIGEGGTVAYHNIGSVEHGMFGLGTPDDLRAFIDAPAPSRRVT